MNLLFLLIDAQSVLSNCEHPIYKRLLLLDGFVFSKSQLTHAVQQYPSFRDHVLEKLCDERIFLKYEVFAKQTSNGGIEYLDGFIKASPVVTGIRSSIEEVLDFGNLLAQYDLSIEEYIRSFTAKKELIQNSDGDFVQHVLTRSDILLKSYLFSPKLIAFMDNNKFYRERFMISQNAVCKISQPTMPTTSNIRMFSSFSSSI